MRSHTLNLTPTLHADCGLTALSASITSERAVAEQMQREVQQHAADMRKFRNQLCIDADVAEVSHCFSNRHLCMPFILLRRSQEVKTQEFLAKPLREQVVAIKIIRDALEVVSSSSNISTQ